MAYAYSTEARVKPLYQAIRAVWYLLDILETLLFIRFLMRLFGANQAATFTRLLYNITYPFVAPFMAVFPQTRVAGSLFEWTTLLAMLVYWLVAVAIVRLFAMNRPVSMTEADYRVSKEDTI